MGWSRVLFYRPFYLKNNFVTFWVIIAKKFSRQHLTSIYTRSRGAPAGHAKSTIPTGIAKLVMLKLDNYLKLLGVAVRITFYECINFEIF